MLTFPETAVAAAAAAAARSCLILRPNALLNDAYKRRRNNEREFQSLKADKTNRVSYVKARPNVGFDAKHAVILRRSVVNIFLIGST